MHWKLPLSTTALSFDEPCQGIPANIRINLILRVIGLHFCRWECGLSSLKFSRYGLWKIYFWTQCVFAVQGHQRSSLLAPIETAFATSYLIITLVLSSTVSEIRRLIGQKNVNFPAPLSFSALGQGEPFRIFGWTLYYIAITRVLGLSVSEDLLILACVVLTQCGVPACDRRQHGRTARRWLLQGSA